MGVAVVTSKGAAACLLEVASETDNPMAHVVYHR